MRNKVIFHFIILLTQLSEIVNIQNYSKKNNLKEVLTRLITVNMSYKANRGSKCDVGVEFLLQ